VSGTNITASDIQYNALETISVTLTGLKDLPFSFDWGFANDSILEGVETARFSLFTWLVGTSEPSTSVAYCDVNINNIPPPVITAQWTPSQIYADGVSTSTLSWSATNTSTLSAEEAGTQLGNLPLSGSSASPSYTSPTSRTVNFTAIGPGGTTTASAVLTVSAPTTTTTRPPTTTTTTRPPVTTTTTRAQPPANLKTEYSVSAGYTKSATLNSDGTRTVTITFTVNTFNGYWGGNSGRWFKIAVFVDPANTTVNGVKTNLVYVKSSATGYSPSNTSPSGKVIWTMPKDRAATKNGFAVIPGSTKLTYALYTYLDGDPESNAAVPLNQTAVLNISNGSL